MPHPAPRRSLLAARSFLPLACLFLAAALPAADEAAPAEAKGTLILPLSGSFHLRPHSGLFAESELPLAEATTRLQRALQGNEGRLVLDLSRGFAPGLAAAEELAAVLRARPAGKQVACLIGEISDPALVVAAACDEVAVVEAGLVMVGGLSASTDYYADALAKLGVRFHAVTSGPAKTAPEPLTRSAPTPAAIAESEALLKGLDGVLIDLSRRGKLDAQALAAARAQAPQPGPLAAKLGLADRAVEPGEWLKSQSEPVRWYEDEQGKPDLSNFAGMMQFWATLVQGDRDKPKAAKVVAVVELEGMVVDGEDSEPGSTIADGDTARLIDQLADDARVVAVVLRVDSPGGSATASDRIHHAIRRLDAKKPVVALLDGVAASGGYYIACAARQILVHRGTITGSIGVFAIVPDLTGTRDLLGINRHTVSTGPRADLWATGPLTPEKQAAIRQVIDDVDQRFQGLVAATRHLPADKVKELSGGRVYTGEQAVALGLADGVGTFVAAAVRARELAGIKDPLPVERHPGRRGLESLLGLRSLGASVLAPAAVLLPPVARPLAWLAGHDRPLVLVWSPWTEPR